MRATFLNAFERVDVVLLCAAAAGLALYFFVLPRVHPDGTVRGHAEKHEIVEAAGAFLARHAGEQLDATRARVRIRRDPSILDSLQQLYGRTEATRLIGDGGIPAYYWEVQLSVGMPDRRAEDDEGTRVNVSSGDEFDQDPAVHLTLDGTPFLLRLDESLLPTSRINGEAFGELMDDELLRSLRDSAGPDRWTFRFNDLPGSDEPGGRVRDDGRTLNEAHTIRPFYLPPERRVLLDRADAAALARYHLEGTMFANGEAGSAVVVDSVTESGQGSRTTATVHVSSAESTPGRAFAASVEVSPTGALLGLEPAFFASPTSSIESMDGLLDLIQMAAFILLALLTLVVFLRSIRHHLIDVGAALRDGTVGMFAAALAVGIGAYSETNLSLSLELVIIILGAALISLLAGVLVFFVSGAADSSARGAWSGKLQTLDLSRHAYVLNVPVGRSLIRGTLVGLGLLGIVSLGLAAFRDSPLALSAEPLFFKYVIPGTQFASAMGSATFFALFITFLTIVSAAALLRRKTSSPAAVIGVVAFVLVITIISPVKVLPVPLTFVFSAALGLALGWTFSRFDVLTMLVAIFTFSLLWMMAPGWVVPSTPERLDAVLSMLLVGGIVATGVFGVAGGRTSEEVPVIVPEYVKELAQKERLERELELARSMQLSFLPDGPPDVPGLDIASICVPAYEVGGDYYDYFRLDERRLAFAVGDVSGKGMQAAFYMTLMKGILQSLVRDGAGPAHTLCRANAIFRMNAARNTFMSMALGVIDVDRRTLIFSRAGHNPLLVRRSISAVVETITPAGAALGLMAGPLFDGSIEEVTVQLERDDMIVVYTDGVTEAMNPQRELFGEERLETLVAGTVTTASEILRQVVDDVNAFCGAAPSHDDMTLLVARFTAADRSTSNPLASRNA